MIRHGMALNQLLFAVVLLFCVSPAHAKIARALKADIDEDGKEENIRLLVKDDGQYVLTVDRVSANGAFNGFQSPHAIEIQLVDIDKSDKLKQIKISYASEIDSILSNADHYYWFVNNKLKRILEVQTQTEYVAILGNGIVHISKPSTFWHKHNKYVFNKKLLKLQLVKQPYYYVGKKGQTDFSFPILFDKRPRSRRVAHVKPKSEIELLVFHDQGWYLVKTSTGLIGWAQEKHINKIFERETQQLHYSP